MRLPDATESRIALIGTARHERSDLADLPGVAHNLTALADTFADGRHGGLSRECIRLLVNPTRPHTTGVEVMAAADEASDVLVVYLAGHLIAGPGHVPQLALAKGGERSRSSMLDLTWVVRSIADSSAPTKVLIVDGLLTGPVGVGLDATATLAGMVGDIAGTSTWLFATSDPAVYHTPDGAGTSFTAAVLAVVHQPSTAAPGLDLEYLHHLTCRLLLDRSLPQPILWMQSANGRPAGAEVALFRRTARLAGAVEVERLRALLVAAGRAERDYHRPAEAVDAFRAAVLCAQRVLGPDHVQTLKTRRQLAHWIGRAGGVDAAEYLFRQLHEDQIHILGATTATRSPPARTSCTGRSTVGDELLTVAVPSRDLHVARDAGAHVTANPGGHRRCAALHHGRCIIDLAAGSCPRWTLGGGGAPPTATPRRQGRRTSGL